MCLLTQRSLKTADMCAGEGVREGVLLTGQMVLMLKVSELFSVQNLNFDLGKQYHFTIKQVHKHDKKYYFKIIKDEKNVFQLITDLKTFGT